MNSANSATATPKLSRWMLIMLVAGNMIGSGIFLLPAALASFGTVSLLSWLFTAGGAILLALVFAYLGQYMPRVGGPYAYCHAAFGEFIGFLVAFTYWIALIIGNAALVVAGVSYAGYFIPELNNYSGVAFMTSVSIVWVFTLINIIGIRTAGTVQVITTVLKMLPLIALASVGIFYIDTNNLAAFNISGQPTLTALSSSAALTLWSFIGVESASIPAEDVENPSVSIPQATIWGTILAAGIYIASTAAVMGIIPANELAHSTAPFALAAQHVFGTWGATMIALGAVVSCLGALNGWILLQGQIPVAAARDKLFPTQLAKLSKRHTPDTALLVSAVIVTGVLSLTISNGLVAQFTFIIKLAVLATLIPYLLTTMAQIMLQIDNPTRFPPNSMVRHVVIACFAFLYSFWAIVGSGQEIVYYGILLFFTGVPMYVYLHWQRRVHSVTPPQGG